MMRSLMRGLINAWLACLCLMSMQVQADGFCPPGSYEPNNGRAPAITCVPYAGGGPQSAPQQQPPAAQWESRWGAIAASLIDGVLGLSTDKRSKQEASSLALKDCMVKGGVNCRIETAYDNQCAVIVAGDGGFNAPNAATLDKAIELGMNTCRMAGRNNCHVYYSNCSWPVRIR